MAEKFSTSTQVLSLTSLKLLRGTDLVCSGQFVGFGAAVVFVRVEFDRVDDLLDLFIGQSGGRDLEASGTIGAGGDEYPCALTVSPLEPLVVQVFSLASSAFLILRSRDSPSSNSLPCGAEHGVRFEVAHGCHGGGALPLVGAHTGDVRGVFLVIGP